MAPFFHRPWQSRASLAPTASLEVRLERFEELSRGRSPGLLALSLWTAVELPRIARPTLVVESATIRRSFTPRVAAASSMPLSETGEWQWRGVFAVPPRLTADPESRYALWFDERAGADAAGSARARAGDRGAVRAFAGPARLALRGAPGRAVVRGHLPAQRDAGVGARRSPCGRAERPRIGRRNLEHATAAR